ncbi:MAG: type 4a pilus biogenesis protein PilO [Desulfobulbaceae bacterium]|nr:type 4a pilus biogenesis protein PilO [Desulfobulbaceae bacterium]MCK5544869.1 type 4a pilus biogenesis protein PilO [Desulfobulbaceae bacterium]
MKRLTNLEKFGLIAAIVVCGTYFYMGKVYDPEAKSLKKTVQSLNAAIKKYNRMGEAPPLAPVKKTMEKRKKELTRVTTELKKAGGRTGDPSEITKILAHITSLAQENRMAIVKITPEDEEEEALFTWAVFKAEMAGSYHDFKIFVARLQEMSRPMQLRELSLEKVGDTGLITITLTLLI